MQICERRFSVTTINSSTIHVSPNQPWLPHVVLNNCAASCISLSTLGQRDGGHSSLLRPSRGAVPCLRTLVTNLSPRRPGFDPRIVNVEFVFDTQALTQFSSVSVFPSSVHHSCSIDIVGCGLF